MLQKGKNRMKRFVKVVALALCVSLVSSIPVQASADYSAIFDAQYYYNRYPDIREAIGMNPDALLQHFLTSGMQEGRMGREDFNVRAYVHNNIDLVSAFGINDLSVYYNHYVTAGKTEGRAAIEKKTPDQPGVLASYSTIYDVNEPRAINVQLASQRIDGMVIQPGETFSFSNSVMSRIPENGYVVATSYAAGKVTSSVGGGICQVSSTLYAAMLLSFIPATERYPHSLQVTYVPVNMDSAIAEGYKDLRFVNPYPYPIRINSVTNNGTLTVSISKAE